MTILLISMLIFRALHANGPYNKWPELTKTSLDLQSTRFCSIIRYQLRPPLTKQWNSPNNLAVTLPADLLMTFSAQYLIGHHNSPPQKLKERCNDGNRLWKKSSNSKFQTKMRRRSQRSRRPKTT